MVRCPANELTRSAAIKFDIEAWFPDQGQYREVVSCSNCTDFQARALKMKVERTTREGNSAKSLDVPHLLNSTLMANTRTTAALLENFATTKGILVPSVLQPFMPKRYRQVIPYTLPDDTHAADWEQLPNGTWRHKSAGTGNANDGNGDEDNDDSSMAEVEPTATAAATAVADSSYPLLLKCVHEKGVRFRTSVDPEIFCQSAPKGIRSGQFVPARREGGAWFVTAFVPSDTPKQLSDFEIHPAVTAAGSSTMIWLKESSPATNFCVVSFEGDDTVANIDAGSNGRSKKVPGLPPSSTSSTVTAEQQGDGYFDNTALESRRASDDANPDSWGLGVLYAGGAAEVSEERASAERRVDADGTAYTKAEFIEFYGGTVEWDAAAPAE